MLLRCFFSLLRLLLHRRCFPATPSSWRSSTSHLALWQLGVRPLPPGHCRQLFLLFLVWTESQFDFYHTVRMHSHCTLRHINVLGTARTSSLGSLLGWYLRHSHNRWSLCLLSHLSRWTPPHLSLSHRMPMLFQRRYSFLCPTRCSSFFSESFSSLTPRAVVLSVLPSSFHRSITCHFVSVGWMDRSGPFSRGVIVSSVATSF
jgi:hypothetical protein